MAQLALLQLESRAREHAKRGAHGDGPFVKQSGTSHSDYFHFRVSLSLGVLLTEAYSLEFEISVSIDGQVPER